MSVLESIFICGVRSFGIDERSGQKFKFYAPLTLFLGQNGCGKTTIIEAIRHACTGDLPGGTKSGQGFISDPYMHHVPYVLGQIKLKILDMRGNKATITRVMRCEKTHNNGLKFSTLDSMISYVKPNGESEELSGRSADLNNMAIHLMGVPPAILNNVLFCHQEQSLWPLDEGAQLKKKFDEIFDSVSYNKCVDTLRKQLKEKNDAFKILQVKLEYSKKRKDEVESKKAKLEDKQEKLKNLDKEIENIHQQLVPVDKRLIEICELENNLQELHNNKSRKENEKKNLIEMQSSLMKNLLTEYIGSDEELRKEIGSFDGNREIQNRKLDEYNEQKKALENTEFLTSETIQKRSAKLVQTKEEKKAYEIKVSERNGIINKLSNTMNCQITSLDSSGDATNAIQMLSKAVAEEKASINRLSDEFKKTNKEQQSVIDKCREKCAQAEQQKRHKSQEITDCQKQLRDFKLKLRDLDISDEKLKSFQKSIANIDKDLENLANSFNEETISKTIDSDKKQIRALEMQLEELDNENKIRQKNSITDNEIENLTSDLLRWENDIEKIKNKYFDEFNLLFPEFPEGEVKKLVTQKMGENTRLTTNITNSINSTQKSVTTLETERKYAQKELDSLENELKQSQTKVAQLCGAVDYDKKCDESQRTINTLQKKKGQWSSAKMLYEKFVEDIVDKKCCPVCSTSFRSKEAAINEIINSIQIKIKDIPGELCAVEKDLAEQEVLYKKLLQLEPVNAKCKELTNSIPKLKPKLAKINETFAVKKEALENLKEEIKPPQNIIEICTKVISGAALIDQNNKDIKKATEKISILKSQLVKVDSNRSKAEMEAEIDNVKDELVTLREMCEKNQKRLNANNKRCQDLREQRNGIFQKQLDLQKDMQGKPQLLERIKENEEKEQKLKMEIEADDDSMNNLKTNLEKAKDEIETTKSRNESTLESARTEYHKHENELTEVNKIHNSIKNVSAEELQSRFEAILREITILKLEKEKLAESTKNLLEEINDVKMVMANDELHFRNLKDNQELREKRKRETIVDSELDELKKLIGSHNYKSVQKEKQELNKSKLSMEQKVQLKLGEKKGMLASIQDITEELERPDNRDIYVTYRNLFIRSRVTEVATQNIKLYVESLENAICIFHKTRMTQINKHIRQLWTQIYKGNDIDYIQINNDVVHVGGRRSYKYQVMQKKNDTLLEMRGRCSAGQKVLACLIIRIALAETFSSNCGILALDEPTTNLDRENIESLSNSLARIIKSRQAQANFQLLVITHDEEFLRALRSVDSLRYYYKVMRNNKGCTVITSELL